MRAKHREVAFSWDAHELTHQLTHTSSCKFTRCVCVVGGSCLVFICPPCLACVRCVLCFVGLCGVILGYTGLYEHACGARAKANPPVQGEKRLAEVLNAWP